MSEREREEGRQTGSITTSLVVEVAAAVWEWGRRPTTDDDSRFIRISVPLTGSCQPARCHGGVAWTRSSGVGRFLVVVVFRGGRKVLMKTAEEVDTGGVSAVK